MTRPITPADIAALRLSARNLPAVSIGQNFPSASVIFDPLRRAFLLLRHGVPKAVSADVALLGQILQNEAAEPGYVVRILDPRADPEIACRGLGPYQTAILNRERYEEQVRARNEAEAEAKRIARRTDAFDLTRIDLDDL